MKRIFLVLSLFILACSSNLLHDDVLRYPCATGGELCEESPVRGKFLEILPNDSTELALIDALHSKSEYAVDAVRIKYQTDDPTDAMTEASALVLFPHEKLNEKKMEPLKVIVWNHGTTGIADACAPSLHPDDYFVSEVKYLASRGYIVVAPDYFGLGNKKFSHSYLLKHLTATSIWNSVQAARSFLMKKGFQMSPKIVMFGHSQGGQGTLFAYEYAHSKWAKNLELIGAVALAPAPVWTAALDGSLYFHENPAPTDLIVQMGGFLWAAAELYPRLKLPDVLQKQIITILDKNLEVSCMHQIAVDNAFGPLLIDDVLTSRLLEVVESASKISSANLKARNEIYKQSLPGWGEAFVDNSPGFFENFKIPLVIVQGSADRTVLANWTQALAHQISQSNPDSNFQLRMIPGGTHASIVSEFDRYMPFLVDQLQVTQATEGL